MSAADVARRADKGDVVTYVVCRNMNFTNVCYVGCTYCGFSRHRDDADAYDHPMAKLIEKGRDAVARGATEFCIQGGIDPKKDHTHYREILLALKAEFPNVHIHAFSPEEIDHGHKQSGMELHDYLRWLADAGLGTIPGTAAEILDDEIRNVIEPRKLKTARWVEIVKAAHAVGLRSTATVMYGHVEEPRHVAGHLGILRDIQKETGGFTEIVPLGFIHEKNRLYQHLGARPGSSAPEDVRLVAVSRLFLRPWIPNVQMSWVKMGTKLAQMALLSGANDFGGTLMEESISRESGADHGENLPARGVPPPDPRDGPHARRAQHEVRDPARLRRSGAGPAEPRTCAAQGPLGAEPLEEARVETSPHRGLLKRRPCRWRTRDLG